MSNKKYLEWNQTEYQIQWDNNPYTWDEVFVLLEVVQLLGGSSDFYNIYTGLGKQKKKKLITLIAKVRGEEFKDESYKNNDIKVIIKDIEIVTHEVLGIQIKVNK